MIKLLKKHVVIPLGVKVIRKENYLLFVGSKGSVEHKIPKNLIVNIEAECLLIEYAESTYVKKNFKKIYSLIITTCVLFKNYIYGVTHCFERRVLLKGIGYKAEYNDKKNVLELFLGYSSSIKFKIPNDIIIGMHGNLEIVVSGVSKSKVGQVAANIREKRIFDVYKGNGIRYKNEIVRLKTPKKNK